MSNLLIGFELMAVGFFVVMVTLFLLYLVLICFSRFCNGDYKTIQKRNKEEEITLVPEADLQLIAAISAAVSSFMSTTDKNLQVVSVRPLEPRKTKAVPGWVMLGRKHLMEKRQGIAMYRRERSKR